MIELRKTLFIGVGGFGKSTLRSIRRKFVEYFGEQTLDIPAVKYLVIDTAPVDQEQYKTLDSIDRLCLPRANCREFISLSVRPERMRAIQGEGNGLQPGTREALDTVLTQKLRQVNETVLENGASCMRAFGKVSFIHKVLGDSEVEDGLGASLQAISQVRPGDDDWQPFRDQFTLVDTGQDLRIVLVSSVAGGTGSGVIFDLCYFIRHLMRVTKLSAQPRFELHLFLPQLLEGGAFLNRAQAVSYGDLNASKLIWSGAAAALSELESYCLGAYEADKGVGFRFDRGFEVSSAAYEPFWPLHSNSEENERWVRELRRKPPADEVYLIGRNACEDKARLTGAQDGIEMTADLLFSRMVVTSLDSDIVGDMTNVAQQLPGPVETESGPSRRHYMRNYGAYGLGKVSVQAPMVRRWAATVRALELVRRLKDGVRVGEGESGGVRARELVDQLGWTGPRVFEAFAQKYLGVVAGEFAPQRLQTLAHLEQVAAEGERAVFFGQSAGWSSDSGVDEGDTGALTAALEKALVEGGVPAARAMLVALQNQLETDAHAAREFIHQEDTSRDPSAFPSGSPVQRWISGIAILLGWLGEHNVPDGKHKLGDVFLDARTAAQHLGELNSPDLRAGWGAKVRPDLVQRFMKYFLAAPSLEHLGGEIAKLAETNPERLSTLCERLRVGLAKTIRRLAELSAERLEAIQERLKHSQQQMDDLASYLDVLLTGGQDNGLEARERALREGSDAVEARSQRVVWVGKDFMQTHNLVAWDEPSEEERQRFRALFGEMPPRAIEGAWAKACSHLGTAFLEDEENPARPWTFLGITEQKNWPKGRSLDIVRDRLVQRLACDSTLVRFVPGREPTLFNYYRANNSTMRERLEEDLQRVTRVSEPYLDFEQLAYGVNNRRPARVRYFLVPPDLCDLARQLVTRGDRLQAREGLDDIIALTIQPGIALPLVSYLQQLNERYEEVASSLGRPDFAWTRNRRRDNSIPNELIRPQAADRHILPEVVLGLMVGNICYRPEQRQYFTETAPRTMTTEFSMTPVGASIGEVIHYFSGGYAMYDRVDPLPRLRARNDLKLCDRRTVAKLGHLQMFYSQWLFLGRNHNENGASHEDHHYVTEILWQRIHVAKEHSLLLIDGSPALEEFNRNEAAPLTYWLHAYCDLAPVVRPSVPDGADAFVNAGGWDWVPVLANEWNPEAARRVSLWFNRIRHKEIAPGAPVQHNGQLHVWAMSATGRNEQIRYNDEKIQKDAAAASTAPPLPNKELLSLMWGESK